MQLPLPIDLLLKCPGHSWKLCISLMSSTTVLRLSERTLHLDINLWVYVNTFRGSTHFGVSQSTEPLINVNPFELNRGPETDCSLLLKAQNGK
jgi:hypothetical protein